MRDHGERVRERKTRGGRENRLRWESVFHADLINLDGGEGVRYTN